AVRWRSSNTAVATVDATGSATATGTGTTQITASTGTAPDTVFAVATLTVTQNLASIEVNPTSLSFEAVGDTSTIALTGKDANGNVIPNLVGTWSSVEPATATVNSSGRVTATGNGNTVVTVQVGALRANVTVSVSQRVTTVTVTPTNTSLSLPGQTAQLSAAATDRRGAPVNGRRTTWSSSDTSVVVVDSTGKVTARRNGTVNIRAQVDSASGSAPVTVAITLPDLTVISATFTPP